MILAGDIGGTHSRLATFELRGGSLVALDERVYPSKSHPGLEAILEKFVAEMHPSLDAAAFGVAGPVQNGRSATPNLPWVLDARALARALRLPSVILLNDLKANAYGLRHLAPEDFAVVHPGDPEAHGNQAVLSAGTGLGQAALIWSQGTHVPFATEGGHADFAPRDTREMELLAYLLRTHRRVSTERVLSGAGQVSIYEFLRDTGRGVEPTWLTERLATGDRAATISSCGLDRSDPLCAEALDLFVSLYGAEAGNVAMRMLATGGVYVGGGIAPKILPRLRDPRLFAASFLDKGRMRGLLERIPVRVVLNDRAALWGAAHCGAFGDA